MKTSKHANLNRFTVRLAIRGVFLSGLLFAAMARMLATDLTVSGNLSVTGTGNSSVTGDLESGYVNPSTFTTKDYGYAGGNWIHFALDLGDLTHTVNSTVYLLPNLNISGGNTSVTSPANITFTGYSANTTWTWQQNLYDNSAIDLANVTPQMKLTDAGVLKVYSTVNSGNIIFDPGNQTITFSNGLTIQKVSTYYDLGVGSSGFAVGNNLAVNNSGGFALGNYATSNATGAFALGTNVSANAFNSVTIGHYNANVNGNNTTWVSSDPAFIVGIGNSSTSANGLVVLNNGIVYAGLGNATADSGTGLPQGVGSRLMWIPQNNSFFAGSPTNYTYGNYVSQWNYGNIGIGDVVIGDNTSVTGNGSVALGDTSYIMPSTGGYADGSVAIGSGSTVTGKGSVAIGSSTVNLNDSAAYYTTRSGGVALGMGALTDGTGSMSAGSNAQALYDGSVAIGDYVGTGGWTYATYGNSTGAVALGDGTVANGPGSVALGLNDFYANGTGAVAIGNDNIPTGNGAVAIGNTNSASANSTVAIGSNITVTGIGSAALGSNLTVSADHALVGGQWALNVNSTSNITFAIGNGNSTTQSNAFTVLKNGDTTITGNATINGANTTISGNANIGGNSTITTLTGNVVLSTPQGDIPMGAYGD